MKRINLTVNLRASCENCLNLSSFDIGRTKLPMCSLDRNIVLKDDWCDSYVMFDTIVKKKLSKYIELLPCN